MNKALRDRAYYPLLFFANESVGLIARKFTFTSTSIKNDITWYFADRLVESN